MTEPGSRVEQERQDLVAHARGIAEVIQDFEPMLNGGHLYETIEAIDELIPSMRRLKIEVMKFSDSGVPGEGTFDRQIPLELNRLAREVDWSPDD